MEALKPKIATAGQKSGETYFLLTKDLTEGQKFGADLGIGVGVVKAAESTLGVLRLLKKPSMMMQSSGIRRKRFGHCNKATRRHNGCYYPAHSRWVE